MAGMTRSFLAADADAATGAGLSSGRGASGGVRTSSFTSAAEVSMMCGMTGARLFPPRAFGGGGASTSSSSLASTSSESSSDSSSVSPSSSVSSSSASSTGSGSGRRACESRDPARASLRRRHRRWRRWTRDRARRPFAAVAVARAARGSTLRSRRRSDGRRFVGLALLGVGEDRLSGVVAVIRRDDGDQRFVVGPHVNGREPCQTRLLAVLTLEETRRAPRVRYLPRRRGPSPPRRAAPSSRAGESAR